MSPAAVLGNLRDRLVSSDPGLTRLILAARVTVAVVLTVTVLDFATNALRFSISLAVLGAVVAMQTLLQVNDDDPRTTTLLIPLPGALGTVLGAVFAPSGIVAEFVFLGVLFAAVAIRLRGPRWTAFGTIATMTYFLSLFLEATLAQVPILICAVMVAVGFSYFSRFVLLRDRPAWIARRTVEALEARIRLVAAAARAVFETSNAARAQRDVDAAIHRLRETAASIEARLGSDASDELRVIFDVELAAEDVAVSALAIRAARGSLPRALRLALLALCRGRSTRAARIAAGLPAPEEAGDEARALVAAIVELDVAIRRVEATSGALAVSQTPWFTIAAQQPPVLPQAVQVTAAAAASMAASEALGSQRWYWSVLAAYFVFIGTSSAAETRARAGSRIAGTAFGVAAGILTGRLAQGHPLIDVLLIFAFLFCSMYVLRVSQTLMIFFITAILALLYTELGRFSTALLETRLLETVIGAVFGGIAATVILPTRTRDVVRAKATEALSAAGEAIRTSIARLLDPNTDDDPLAAAHLFEERVQEFIARARPSVRSPVLHESGRRLRRWIVALTTCSYYARTLARVVDRSNAVPHHSALLPLWRLDAILAANVHAAAERINGYPFPATDAAAPFEALRRAAAPGRPTSETLATAAQLLERLNRTLGRLASDDPALTEAPRRPRQ